MGFFDSVVARRIATGLQRIAADKALWDDIMDGSVDDKRRDEAYDRIFPLETIDSVEARAPRVTVRTAYPRMPPDGRSPPDPAARPGQGSTAGCVVTVDLAEEVTIKRELGGRRRLDRETVEILVSAGDKDDVRCLHQAIREIVEDSLKFFASLGYSMALAEGPSGDLRPTDGAFLGMPHLLGAFSRYLRCVATANRTRTRIFSEDSPKVDGAGAIRVNHVDAFDDFGNPGGVEPTSAAE